mgnify:CR=1 FL=1
MTRNQKVQHSILEIPGGDSFIDTVDPNRLPLITRNWLKARSNWQQFALSTVGKFEDVSELGGTFKVSKKMYSTNSREQKQWWLRGDVGLGELANDIAKVFAETDHLLAVVVDEKGIATYTDTEKKFDHHHEKWNLVIQFWKQ